MQENTPLTAVERLPLIIIAMVIDGKDNDLSWLNCAAENKAHKDLLLLIDSAENIFKKTETWRQHADWWAITH